jgi:hypothetical protein
MQTLSAALFAGILLLLNCLLLIRIRRAARTGGAGAPGRAAFFAGAWTLVIWLAFSLQAGPFLFSSRHQTDACLANLKGLAVALATYSLTHNEAFPEDLQALDDYHGNLPAGLFLCPQAGRQPVEGAGVREWTDYAFVAGLGPGDSRRAILVVDPPENHGGRGAAVLYRNFDVEWIPASRFAAIAATNGTPGGRAIEAPRRDGAGIPEPGRGP